MEITADVLGAFRFSEVNTAQNEIFIVLKVSFMESGDFVEHIIYS